MEAHRELIRIEGVTKRFGHLVAVDTVSTTIRENEFFALLGPSGCGKTTLLRLLAGFEAPDAGRLLLDGRDLVGMRPYRRPLNMMFQSYALFPHMTVFDNIAYGLRQERTGRDEIERRVNEVLALVQLGGFGRRRPHQLSGGERQRVALARALVKRPQVLLLDEPLAALDRKLRVEMQLELKRLQHTVGITFLIVTHDQEEALVMADRVAVMDRGRILQVASPDELYEAPGSRFVASFIGESNIFAGRLRIAGDAVTLVGERGTWHVAPAAPGHAGLADGAAAAIVVRPERLRLAPAGARASLEDPGAGGGLVNRVDGVLSDVAYLGSTRKYVVELRDGTRALARVQVGQRGDDLAPGTPVGATWAVEHGVLIADETASPASPGA
ncbi:MAG: hypothetical protein A2X23_09670 [Chloroflexi bacterium GWC2_73_18]|nr:MAG: hypothetical protein A2X23_09670 [Chloroflexi bacterium GWC2_73_18]